MAFSETTLSQIPISGSLGSAADDVCQSGAISSFALGSVVISGICPSATPPIIDGCQTGALGDFAYSSVTLSATCGIPPVFVGICQDGGLAGFAFGAVTFSDNCPFISPIPPTPAVNRDGHSKIWRPIREDVTTRRVQDDNEVALWLAQFVASQS